LTVAEKVYLPVARILVVDFDIDSARVAVALKDRDDFESEHRWCHDSRRWCATLWRILRNVPTLEISFEIEKVSIQKLDAHSPLASMISVTKATSSVEAFCSSNMAMTVCRGERLLVRLLDALARVSRFGRGMTRVKHPADLRNATMLAMSPSVASAGGLRRTREPFVGATMVRPSLQHAWSCPHVTRERESSGTALTMGPLEMSLRAMVPQMSITR
jgi:hypothetical protein